VPFFTQCINPRPLYFIYFDLNCGVSWGSQFEKAFLAEHPYVRGINSSDISQATNWPLSGSIAPLVLSIALKVQVESCSW